MENSWKGSFLARAQTGTLIVTEYTPPGIVIDIAGDHSKIGPTIHTKNHMIKLFLLSMFGSGYYVLRKYDKTNATYLLL